MKLITKIIIRIGSVLTTRITMMNKQITRVCCICGKEFNIELKEEDAGYKILTDCFYGGKVRLGVGNWAYSKAKTDEKGNPILDKDGFFISEKCNSWWQELKYRLIDLKRTIFRQYTEIEYWECPACFKGRQNA